MTTWYIFCQGKLLLQKVSSCSASTGENTYTIPSGEQPPIDKDEAARLFCAGHNAVGFYVSQPDLPSLSKSLCQSRASDEQSVAFTFIPLRETFSLLPAEKYQIATKLAELTYWDEQTQYCSHCGTVLEPLTEISKQCPNCHQEFWPQLSIAVIVLIRRGNEALLVRAKNFRKYFFGLVAGFVETGETLEEAVQREVKEETGLTISNIQYHYSQPWPFPSGLMVGFFADYQEGDLRIDQSELIEGGWFTRQDLPTLPDEMSIARRLIEEWKSTR